MNEILKALIYMIFLCISMLGGLAASLFGMTGLALVFVSACQMRFDYTVIGFIMALIGILGQKFFNSLDPAPMYYDREWD
jgi:uncharacterized membrane protein